MINKHNQIKKISKKFDEIKTLDGDYKPLKVQKLNSMVTINENSPRLLRPSQKKEKKNENQIGKSHEGDIKQQLIYTQSEISKQVAKLKPYLAFRDNIRTSKEEQEIRNKQISQQNYKMMSELAILQNRRLCEVVDEEEEVQENVFIGRREMQNEGWIFEFFHRSTNYPKQDITKKSFISGYAVMTEKVEIYESMTFQKLVYTIIPSAITLVGYEQESDYEIITIEQEGNKKIQCGFLDDKKFDLFDRFLFLQKNMSRSTSTRLFQNQLIQSIYAQYEKH